MKKGLSKSFSYNIKTVQGKSTNWAHRMDHYTKINSHYQQVYHEQLIMTSLIIVILVLVFG